MDLLSHWTLNERPFEATWDTRFFFRTRDHEEALERLTFLVTETSMNMGMLTGDIGCGKTLLQAVFVDGLDDERFEVVVQENSSFCFRELLGAMLRALGDNFEQIPRSKIARYERLKEHLRKLHQENRHLVLLFDEAQEMSSGTLNELKLLTNLNGDGRNYLTIVLVGQPELRERVATLPAIDQRISLRFHLAPLTPPETAAYLRHRLTEAGHQTGDLFAEEAVQRTHFASRGIPREINRIAKLALEVAWLNEFPVVTASAVDAVVRDLQRHQKFRAA